ncbi:ABC transporter ATP-binding protein [Halalkalibacter sp. APA_J-10(15)]|uniref:ABC transporter ATP-binding protein n=1 Tax=unclassified Halalkalibacter TaxID=2893063 RepID=UPI001FF6A755|nr:ABC transporter ATP-binding protein [Halalkalibacter sp. APA_J-10(15)]MCK0473255.1 ABC transporter ATP-binding protein [Halalkalibacter sp. APA_J-10(15)]
MIHVQNVTKSFSQGAEQSQVLKGVDLDIEQGEFVAVMGPSGSGKSTLLQLLGGLDIPDEGTIEIGDERIEKMREKDRTIFRRRNVGFVFQNYQLLQNLSVEENIAFPIHADGTLKPSDQKKINGLIKAVGLTGLEKKRVNLLSGGQQQRVAMARALANNPGVLLADEPTGNLDRAKAEEILALMVSFHRNDHQTIVMVTHDIFAAGFADRIVLFKDGKVERIISRKDDDYAEYLANFMA